MVMKRTLFVLCLSLMAGLFLYANSHGTPCLNRLGALGFLLPEKGVKAPPLMVRQKKSRMDLTQTRSPVLLYFFSSHIPASLGGLAPLKHLKEELKETSWRIAPVDVSQDFSKAKASSLLYEGPEDIYCHPKHRELAPYILAGLPSLWLLHADGTVAAVFRGTPPWEAPGFIRSLKEMAGD